ncbi:MAG: hypothetical protein GY861_19905, partial [bacterium]|nr:hypothetical protein [bacterium]
MQLENAPCEISEPFLENTDEGVVFKCKLVNPGSDPITAIHIILTLYYSLDSEPKTVNIKTPIDVQKGKTIEFTRTLNDVQSLPVSGVTVPAVVETNLSNTWTARSHYIKDQKIVPVSLLKLPDTGLIRGINGKTGYFESENGNSFFREQPFIVTRGTDGKTETIATISYLKKIDGFEGFEVDYRYPGKVILPGDKVRLIYPGTARLNLTSRGMAFSGLFAGFAGTGYQILKVISDDKRENATNPSDTLYYTTKIEENRKLRNSALIASGLFIGNSIISELIWGRKGNYHLTDHAGWNTTTRSFLTFSALSFTTAFYYDYQKWSKRERIKTAIDPYVAANYRREAKNNSDKCDIAMLYGGISAISGIMNHLLVKNKWPV